MEMFINPFDNVPKIILSKVDFPQPFLPKIPNISPVSRENEISFRTSFFPKAMEALCNLKFAKYKKDENN